MHSSSLKNSTSPSSSAHPPPQAFQTRLQSEQPILDSVTAAFEGQNTVVSTVRTPSLPEYGVLVEAAIAAFFRPTLAATWLTQGRRSARIQVQDCDAQVTPQGHCREARFRIYSGLQQWLSGLGS